ncbi:flagellar hook capping FlgD N-terminal domain-containing protein [Lutimaribacter marinistellae]|uniref:Basal-body rod modification protein FlgD n=1 Tax=Lutimaribacter marinistellae TaxID=1820329 RepID=A0ABV7T9H0_9RHOB
MTMEITQSASAPRSSTSAKPGNQAGLSSDFETFLNMLTAQARYQDPLEPIDSSQYAAQLAQFSMVEQQVQTNDMLTALVSRLGGASIAELAGWVGMEARSLAPAHYQGTPITVMPQIAENALTAALVVRDATGTVVDRQQVDVSGEAVDWIGGPDLPNGLYSFSTESYQGDELLDDLATPSYRRITEARLKDGEVLLELSGGSIIRSVDVTGLRQGG